MVELEQTSESKSLVPTGSGELFPVDKVEKPKVIPTQSVNKPSGAVDKSRQFSDAADKTPTAVKRQQEAVEAERRKQQPQWSNQDTRKVASSEVASSSQTTQEHKLVKSPKPPSNNLSTLFANAQKALIEFTRKKPEWELEIARKEAQREKWKEARDKFRKKRRRALPPIYREEEVSRKVQTKKVRGTKKADPEVIAPDENLIPVSDIPLALLVGPLLDEKQPLSNPTNQARLQLLEHLAKKSLDAARNLAELIDIGDILITAGVTSIWQYQVDNLRYYLQQHSDIGYTDFDTLATRTDFPEVFHRSIADIWYAIEALIDSTRSDFDNPFVLYPTLLPAVDAGQIMSEINLKTALQFATSHLGYISVSDERMTAYAAAYQASRELPVASQLAATIPTVALQERYRDQVSDFLPPQQRLVDVHRSGRSSNTFQWLLANPPRAVLRALIGRYKNVFEAFGSAVPEVPELRLDPSCLVVSKSEQSETIDTQALLEKYSKSAAELALFSRDIMPAVTYFFALQRLRDGEKIDYKHFSADLLQWLRTDGIAELQTYLGPSKLGMICFEKAKNQEKVHELVQPEELILSLQDALKLLSFYDYQITQEYTFEGNKDNPVVLLTQLIHEDYGLETLAKYPTIAEKMLTEAKKRGYLILDKELEAYVIPKGPTCFITLPNLANLAGITDQEKIKTFCHILRDAVLNPMNADRKANPNSSDVAVYADAQAIRTGIHQQAESNSRHFTLERYVPWLLPSGYSPDISTENMIALDGSKHLTEIANLNTSSFRRRSWRDDLLDELGTAVADFSEKTTELSLSPQFLRQEIVGCASHNLTESQARILLLHEIKKIESREQQLKSDHDHANWLQELLPTGGGFVANPERNKKRTRLAAVSAMATVELQSCVEEKANLLHQLEHSDNILEPQQFDATMLIGTLIRPIIASMCLAVLSIDASTDKDITELCDFQMLQRYGVPNSENKAVLTAKSLATAQLLEVIDALDRLSARRMTYWEELDTVIKTAQNSVFAFETYLQDEDIPSKPVNVAPLLVEPDAYTIVSTIPDFPHEDIPSDEAELSLVQPQDILNQKFHSMQSISSLSSSDREALRELLKTEMQNAERAAENPTGKRILINTTKTFLGIPPNDASKLQAIIDYLDTIGTQL